MILMWRSLTATCEAACAPLSMLSMKSDDDPHHVWPIKHYLLVVSAVYTGLVLQYRTDERNET